MINSNSSSSATTDDYVTAVIELHIENVRINLFKSLHKLIVTMKHLHVKVTLYNMVMIFNYNVSTTLFELRTQPANLKQSAELVRDNVHGTRC